MDVMYYHFIMEYCEGGDLFAPVIKTGPLNESEVF